MSLLDALSCNTNAKSVAELSLNPIFNYQYASVYDAIDPFFSASTLTEAEQQRWQKEIETINLILSYLPAPMGRRFWLFALDTTSTSRPYAHTLADRGIVYQPNPVGKNKPVTIGHQYAALVYFLTLVNSPPGPQFWGSCVILPHSYQVKTSQSGGEREGEAELRKNVPKRELGNESHLHFPLSPFRLKRPNFRLT